MIFQLYHVLLIKYHSTFNISKVYTAPQAVTVAGAALRWLSRHSLLDGSQGDCILLGASRPEQLRMNLELVGA